MISPSPDRDQPAKPPMTFKIPAAPVKPRPMALQLLEELDQISGQAEAIALELRRLELSSAVLEQIQPGASVTAGRIVCRLETSAEFLRHLQP